MKHLEVFSEYAKKRHQCDAMRKALGDLDKERYALESQLVDAMVDAKVKSFALDGGMTVSIRRRFDVSVNKDNNDLVEKWLFDTFGDVTPFQKLVLYKPAVVKKLKDLAAAEQLDETTVPPFLNLKTTPGVTVRGWQGGSSEDEE